MSIVYLEKTDIGSTLAAWLYCAMWQLYSAEQSGNQGYINWPKDRSLKTHQDDVVFARLPNMYDWYLEQPSVKSPLSPQEVWTWEIGRPEISTYNLMNNSAAVIRSYFKKNCRFNIDVETRGAALVAKYNIDFASTIGVTWRGTDCVTDGRPYLPIEVYFPFIDDILNERPGLRIIATAEEDGVLDPLLKRYSQAVSVSEFYSVPSGCKQSPEWFNPSSGYERGMQPALMMWLFSKCMFYVKNRSNTGLVASWLSDGESVCLAHPENGGHGFDITKAEVRGEIVPLYRL